MIHFWAIPKGNEIILRGSLHLHVCSIIYNSQNLSGWMGEQNDSNIKKKILPFEAVWKKLKGIKLMK